MGFTKEYRASVEEKLTAVTMIQTKAMFGGVGIYTEGLIFALIGEDKLYFKVDDSNRTDFEEKGMGPFYPFDSPTPMGYWELPGGVLENPNDLKVWIDKAVAVAKAASLKKKPRVKRG